MPKNRTGAPRPDRRLARASVTDPASHAPEILDRTFRAGRRFDLVVYDRLEPSEREVLRSLHDDGELYGVLRPLAGAGAPVKAVGRDLALLLFTLREPGRLPSFALADLEPAELRRRIAALVLDGVLELRTDDGFVCGARALSHLGLDTAAAAGGSLTRLSERALRCAAAGGLDDLERQAWRLYSYHRIPLSPRFERRFPDSGRVRRVLGLNRSRLGTSWWPRPSGEPWLHWTRSGRAVPAVDRPTFKLYVSPAMEDLAETAKALADSVSGGHAFQLKVGAGAAGLLRPDKMVAYFADFEALAETADDLLRRVDGAKPHGVPFTAEVGGGGLASWGLDPPSSSALISWRRRWSWRSWIVDRLSSALCEIPEEPGRPRWRVALDRLQLEGVDVVTWRPAAYLWASAADPAAV